MQRQQVRPEGGLHLRVLVQLVQDDLGLGVAPQLDHDPHPLAVRLVAEVGDPGDVPLLDQLGDPLDQGRLVHLVGDLGDDDGVLARSCSVSISARARTVISPRPVV